MRMWIMSAEWLVVVNYNVHINPPLINWYGNQFDKSQQNPYRTLCLYAHMYTLTIAIISTQLDRALIYWKINPSNTYDMHLWQSAFN